MVRDVRNIRRVKLISKQLAGWKMEAREGGTDGASYEEGQDSGVRQGEYIIILARGERQRREEIKGGGLENGHLLGQM